MSQTGETKEKLLHQLREHITFIRQKIDVARAIAYEFANKPTSIARSLKPEDQVAFFNLRAESERRYEELVSLYKTPYFMKCELLYDGAAAPVTYHFAKYQFSEHTIYSWVAPIASIRFEAPGPASYKLPTGVTRRVKILSKEQYMIVDGKPVFFARETLDTPRDLIYQEHFSTRTGGFVLPEIVAQMEKAQDQVIRAHHKGPLVIAGPAGSGKTTLAFHRVAYLAQAPDTSAFYPTRTIIIFVQDTGTKDYFAGLLPELGIKGVTITTFSEWAFKLLNLEGHTYQIRYGRTPQEQDHYEYEKLTVLRGGARGLEQTLKFNARPYMMLGPAYEAVFSPEAYKLFEKQKKEKILDRFDVTLLLRAYFDSIKKIKIRGDKYEIDYSLILVDEFQNYLPEQLLLLKRCVNEETKSMLYIGDLAQQIAIGTLRDWSMIGETINADRHIMLSKVYRNTKNILAYIKDIGYSISVPEQIKSGPDVVEQHAAGVNDGVAYVASRIAQGEFTTIGIIARTEAALAEYRAAFGADSRVHIKTMAQSQGVEFDVVCVVGVDRVAFPEDRFAQVPEQHRAEQQRIEKDLLYIALTRAMRELHVIGSESLKKIVAEVLPRN